MFCFVFLFFPFSRYEWLQYHSFPPLLFFFKKKYYNVIIIAISIIFIIDTLQVSMII